MSFTCADMQTILAVKCRYKIFFASFVTTDSVSGVALGIAVQGDRAEGPAIDLSV